MNTLMNTCALISMTILFTAGCSSNNGSEEVSQEMEVVETKFTNSGKYLAIIDQQILDPSAPETNAGVVNSLNGALGQEAMNNYRKSTYAPKEGRASTSSTAGSSSGSTSRN
ncbi:hypothetical protein [Thalassotalea mangrovi]|uniref:Uncharacterized protein n=1 Tax=Thalassotalea mangrovi TaxID=2572245 RepID=A0A4V5NU25_9GAMM|nr:hypothetical protein [Thalassotalea mangrovi]TKB44227.1 hypothetical protein E8M12_12495 [Thalassotalea mangrovi]